MANNFNLDFPVTKIPLIGPSYAQKLAILNIQTARDLIYHFPFRYLDYSHASRIFNIQIGDIVVIKGIIGEIKNDFTKKGMSIQKTTLTDDTGKITLVWFNQRFLSHTLKPGTIINTAGKIDFWAREKALINPDYEIISENKKNLHTTGLVPIYPETKGISSKWLRSRINYLLKSINSQTKDLLPMEIIKKNELLDVNQALNLIHFPNSLVNAQKARYRFAFEELFLLQLNNLQRRRNWEKLTAIPLKIHQPEIKKFIDNLKFNLTEAQKRCIQEILVDLTAKYPMNRMLEGDVGSGKTIVAAVVAFNTYLNGYQTALMAPTEILAQQHFDTLNKVFAHTKIKIGLITGSVKRNLDADLLVGTHALLYKQAIFQKLALVIIDEQHRFGVEQRAQLLKPGQSVHLLTMTATPIPRTIALTLFGDLNLSIIDEMPSGRRVVKTWVIPQEKRAAGYDWIKKQIALGGQVFIVCPLIERSETLESIKSAKDEFNHLQKSIFITQRLGLLHGRMKTKEKNEVLNLFREKKLDILVSTPVVEVGVDIPNATILIIEAAERFGLAQLHQLRGRIGRSDKQSYCLLFTNIDSGKPYERLKSFEQFHEGNKLAQLDLKMRGPGEVYGTLQHGFPELKVARFDDWPLIKTTQEAAKAIFPDLNKWPDLQESLKQDKIDRSKLN